MPLRLINRQILRIGPKTYERASDLTAIVAPIRKRFGRQQPAFPIIVLIHDFGARDSVGYSWSLRVIECLAWSEGVDVHRTANGTEAELKITITCQH